MNCQDVMSRIREEDRNCWTRFDKKINSLTKTKSVFLGLLFI